jgi:hypothetical protein
VDCAGNYTISGTADVWSPTTLIVTVNGTIDIPNTVAADNGQNHNVLPYTITGTDKNIKPGMEVSARTSDSEHTVTSTLTDGGGDCTPPTCKETNTCKPPVPHHHKKHIVRRPKVGIIGPCGDPFYAAVFDNLHSNRAVYFRWAYTSYATGRTVIVGRWVRAHRLVTTQFRHVLGYSTQYVWARRAFLKVRTAAPGNYGVCRG